MNTQDKLKEQNARNYGNARERVFTVRLTQEEADHLNAIVAQTGQSKGSLIRAALQNIQVKQIDDRLSEKMVKELKSIGVNLNQLTSYANGLKKVGMPLHGLESKVNEFKNLVDRMEGYFK